MVTQQAQQYATALRHVNLSIPLKLVQNLLDILADLEDSGKIRSAFEKYSVLDFIANVAAKGNQWEVWKRLVEAHPDVLTVCEDMKFPRSDGRANIKTTPVTNKFGILVIAYLLPGKFGDRLRNASANLVLEAIASCKGSFESLLTVEQVVDSEVIFLRQQLAERNQIILEKDQIILEQSQTILEQSRRLLEFELFHAKATRMIDFALFDHAIQETVYMSGYAKSSVRGFVKKLLHRLELNEWREAHGCLYVCNPVHYSIIAASRSDAGIKTKELEDFLCLRMETYCRVIGTGKNHLFPKKNDK